jgi:large subunit ribosomal protein L9
MTKTKVTCSQKRKAAKRGKRMPKGPHGGVELLLIQPVEHLGKQDEVVEVKPGYAYNYLLPQGLATLPSEHHKRMIAKHRARLAEIQKERMASFRALADQLAEQSITIEANANDEGHLYGSVGATEIVAGLKKNDFTITTDQVRLEGPLRELGLYTVKIHLAQDVEGELKVWVVPSVTDEVPAPAPAPAKEDEAAS